MAFKLAHSFASVKSNGLAAMVGAMQSLTATLADWSRVASRADPTTQRSFGFDPTHATAARETSLGSSAATGGLADFARTLQQALLQGDDQQYAKDARDALVDMNQNGVKIKNLPDTTARFS